MTEHGHDTPGNDQTTSRRLFFKFLAASPLAALAYAGSAPRLLSTGSARATATECFAACGDDVSIPCRLRAS